VYYLTDQASKNIDSYKDHREFCQRGHPYFLQRYAHIVWNIAFSANSSTIMDLSQIVNEIQKVKRCHSCINCNYCLVRENYI
jgi:hypothetical protein